MRRTIARPQDGAWFPVLFDAVAAASALLVARLGTLRDDSSQAGMTSGKQSRRSRAQSRSLDRPAILAATRPAATLIESLAPQSRRAEPLDGRESVPEPEMLLVCEIASWRGYVKWQFYVTSQSPLEASFSSPYFRARGNRAPERTDAALGARAALAEKLIAAGWQPDGSGEHWFSERFRRGANA